jgi:hypothetical protein
MSFLRPSTEDQWYYRDVKVTVRDQNEKEIGFLNYEPPERMLPDFGRGPKSARTYFVVYQLDTTALTTPQLAEISIRDQSFVTRFSDEMK